MTHSASTDQISAEQMVNLLRRLRRWIEIELGRADEPHRARQMQADVETLTAAIYHLEDCPGLPHKQPPLPFGGVK